MVPSGPTIAILEKMGKVSVEENDIGHANIITPARCFLVRDHAEGTVFSTWDNEPLLLHTTVNFVVIVIIDILVIIGA